MASVSSRSRERRDLLEEITHKVLALRIASVGLTLAGSVSFGIFSALLGSFGGLKVCQRWPRDYKEEQQPQNGFEFSRECRFRDGDRIAIFLHRGTAGKVKALQNLPENIYRCFNRCSPARRRGSRAKRCC
jgi:hypothetical protein